MINFRLRTSLYTLVPALDVLWRENDETRLRLSNDYDDLIQNAIANAGFSESSAGFY